MESYKLYAAGQFIDSKLSYQVVNPYNKQVFAKVCLANEEILEQAILAGLSAEKPMAELPVFKRAEILKHLSKGLIDNRMEFARLIVMETAKPLRYALGEVDRAAQTYSIAAEEAKRIQGELIRLDWTPAGKNKEGSVRRFPIGLVAGISPFNFPLNLTAHKLAPAIAAGNPIIIKPATQTPVSMLRLAEFIHDSDLPKGAVALLPMSRDLGNNLVRDQRIKLLSFTGSPAVGWALKAQSGKKKVLLELGGNAGVYISHSANVEDAASRCVSGGFAFSGQVCIHVQRIYIHREVFEKFAEVFVRLTRMLKEGDPMDPATEIAPLIDESNAIRVNEWVEEAKESGAKVICGGIRTGNYYPPTVLTQTSNRMKVCSMEVFGPVVTLQPVEGVSEAIDLINDSRYGLQAGIFTDSLSEVEQAYNLLQVGGVIVNDIPTFRVDHMPYGGVKDSGLGREGLKYAIDEMTEPKLLVKSM